MNRYVQIGARLGSHFPSIIYDQAQGAWLATQHLIDLEHRQIAESAGHYQTTTLMTDTKAGWQS
jgi:DNA-binding LacI/PurR family transcriptional regulator